MYDHLCASHDFVIDMTVPRKSPSKKKNMICIDVWCSLVPRPM